MFRSSQEWADLYLKREAFWKWDGNPAHGHPKLRSGLHSNVFFNSRPIIKDDELMYEVASDLVKKAAAAGVNLNAVDCVVGPKTGATKLAEYMATTIGHTRGRTCRWASPAKPESDDGDMFWDDPVHVPKAGDNVLLCEDVLTTAKSVKKAEKASVAVGAKALPFFVVMVNRSNSQTADDKRIVALIAPTVSNWPADECDACKAGSEPVADPKDHWAKLIGTS